MNRARNYFIFSLLALVLILEALFALGEYRKLAVLSGEDRAAQVYLAKLAVVLYSFRKEYHEWPGPPGKIDADFICELEGCPKAKINTNHINFYKQSNFEIMETNRFGYNFEFYPSPSGGFTIGIRNRDPNTGLPSTLFSIEGPASQP